MKKFKTLEEYHDYMRKKSLESYHRKMQDPVRAALYREKRRAYEKKRYQKIMAELKNRP